MNPRKQSSFKTPSLTKLAWKVCLYGKEIRSCTKLPFAYFRHRLIDHRIEITVLCWILCHSSRSNRRRPLTVFDRAINGSILVVCHSFPRDMHALNGCQFARKAYIVACSCDLWGEFLHIFINKDSAHLYVYLSDTTYHNILFMDV